jgi:Tol biopolymer transport system component/predicted Ser/Thr protein kinase
MTPERWARIEEVFGEALERPEDERAAFLQAACGRDEQLRQDVERLLAEERNPSFRSPLAASELAAGEMLGRYGVEAKLGQGGMGVVYKAYDSVLQRPVALKILPDWRLVDPESRQRLVREARAASALDHPNIVTIHDIGCERGVDFIAMEYVPGTTLTKLIGRKGLPVDDALKYAVQIADALAAAHGAGIVHRDLKPANIMISDVGRVKVLDFGLAKLARRGPEGGEAGSTQTMLPETETGTVLGTVAYMSPEQAEGKKVDARSDIFSFGAVLYEMLTAQRAFLRDSTASTLAAILKEEPKAAGQVVEGLPRDVERIVKRCLRKDPAQRFQHMGDLKVDLEELKRESDSGALEATGAPKPRPRRRLLWAVGIALALAAAAIGIWVVRLKTRAPEADLAAFPLTSYPGTEYFPSFSPDGAQVVFQLCPEDPGKTCQIYIKQIGVEPPVRLTDSPALSYSPAWSPDGRTIAFCRRLSPTRMALILIPQRGGRERMLAEWDEGGSLEGPFLAWTPDSRWLVSPVREDSSKGPWALFLFSAETGEKRRLTTPLPGLGSDSTPAFSPDGRTLAFSRQGVGKSDLYLLRLAEDYMPQGEPERIASDNPWNAGAAWTPDGSEIVFSSGTVDNWSSRRLWRVAASKSAKSRRLVFASDGIFQPAVSRLGSRLAYVARRFDSNIWRVDLAEAGQKPGIPTKFISSTKPEYCPAYSPDGKRIAFVSERSGAPEVWVSENDGANSTQLTSLGGPYIYGPQWSPGGESISFHAAPGGKEDIYVVSANGGAPRRLTSNPGQSRWPYWSGDGQWLYFTRFSGGTAGFWRMPAAGGEAVQITRNQTDGSDVPRESPDGKWLYYQKGYPPPVSVWRMPVAGGEQTKVLDSVKDSWTVRNEGIYFITTPDKQRRRSICLREFATGKIRQIATIERPPSLGLAVSPDGRTLLYSQIDERGSDLMLVENFR